VVQIPSRMETVGFHARQAPPDERSSTVRSLSRESSIHANRRKSSISERPAGVVRRCLTARKSSICEAMLRMAHPCERRERSEHGGKRIKQIEYFRRILSGLTIILKYLTPQMDCPRRKLYYPGRCRVESARRGQTGRPSVAASSALPGRVGTV
jgi:hypothetical protein